MAVKISDLTTDSAPTLADSFVETERGGSSFKMSLDDIKALIGVVGGGGDPDMPIGISRSVTNGFTLALSDAGHIISVSLTTNSTFTVPNNTTVAFPIGTRVWINVVSGSGVSLNKVAASGVTIIGFAGGTQGSTTRLVKIGTNTWWGGP